MRSAISRIATADAVEVPIDAFQVRRCPVCMSSDFSKELDFQGCQVQQCRSCRLKFLNPQPTEHALSSIYSANYFLGNRTPQREQQISELKRATARLYLDTLAGYSARTSGRLLEIGCGSGDLLSEAQGRGFEVTGVEYSAHAAAAASKRLAGGLGKVLCGEVENMGLPDEHFDVCVLSDVIEHVRRPDLFLRAIHRLLKPGGELFIATPSLDSWTARLLGKHWMEYKPEHLFYFDRSTIQHLLFMNHFNRVLLRSNTKVLTPRYIFAHFDRYEVPVLTQVSRLAIKILPAPLMDRHISMVASGMVVMARKQESLERRKLSVIVPAFNERHTFAEMMEELIRKEIDGLEIEIVIVESNSTDGTREEALRYQSHPRVTLLLEDEPRGKGYAVRAGLQQATGDFILVQDADLEYDMRDYEDLLKPLQVGRAAFVLGSRHGPNGAWKMRHFVDQPVTASVLNAGHIFFTTLLNVLYRQRLKDPFTMYKVFRRDCLFGLQFECNRFDFDHELVIKLVRKGYAPVEIPVSYQSRSFKEGKKVSLFRDPLTWIQALFKFRVRSLCLAENVRESNLAE